MAAALVATESNPKGWTQKWQMFLGLLALVGAFALAGILVLQGPPTPKAATVEPGRGVVGAQVFTVAEPSPGEGASGSGGGTDEKITETELEREEGEASEETEPAAAGPAADGESSGEESESLANLSKQGPWAFAIVALLVGAFIATGKNMSLGGKSGGTGDESSASGGTSGS